MSEPLARVDSAIEGLSTSPTSKEHPDIKNLKLADRIDSGIADVAETEDPKPLKKADSGFEELSPEEEVKRANELEALDKIDEGVAGLSTSPPKEAPAKETAKEKAAHRRVSSSVNALPTAKDLWETKTPLQVSIETQKTGWKINSSSLTVEDRDILKKPLVTPFVRSIDLVTHLGLVMTVRAKKRSEPVTIKDALDAIHHKNKKKDDDELDLPYLAGFEWNPSHMEYKETEDGQAEREQDWNRLYIHLSSTPGVSGFGSKKKKNKDKSAE